VPTEGYSIDLIVGVVEKKGNWRHHYDYDKQGVNYSSRFIPVGIFNLRQVLIKEACQKRKAKTYGRF
jgi:hypothetical protein